MRDTRVVKNCVQCGLSYKEKLCRAERTKYCSLSCRNMGFSQIRGEKHPLFGKACKETTRAKIGKANKGHKHSEEHKNKLRALNLGKKFSTDFCEKMKIFNSRPRLGERGEKHHNWKGGVSPINNSIRHSLEYTQWRDLVFKRDNYTCVKCKVRGAKLHADHIKLFAFFPALRFDIANGQTLCVLCHKVKSSEDMKSYWINQYSSYAGTIK